MGKGKEIKGRRDWKREMKLKEGEIGKGKGNERMEKGKEMRDWKRERKLKEGDTGKGKEIKEGENGKGKGN